MLLLGHMRIIYIFSGKLAYDLIFAILRSLYEI
jgi:hypothetical protein